MRRRDRDGRDVRENGSAEMSRRVVRENLLMGVYVAKSGLKSGVLAPELRRWERARAFVRVCVRVCGYSYVVRGYVSRSEGFDASIRDGTRRERRAKNSATSHPTRSPSS